MKYDISEFRAIEKDVRGERNEWRYLETESEGAQTFFSTIKYTLLRIFFPHNSIESEINGGRNNITESSCSISLEIPYARVAMWYVQILLNLVYNFFFL